MSETEAETELHLGISENESLAVQVLITVIGFIALILTTYTSFKYERLLLSTFIVYGIIAYSSWYLIKAVRGAPNALKPKGDPITLADFLLYLIVAIPVALVANIVWNKVRIEMRLL